MSTKNESLMASFWPSRTLKIGARGRDDTPKNRPLVNVYLPDSQEVSKILLKEGLARPWRPREHADRCN
ncbi:hypothetical protein [Rhizobium mongolense]|uniref:Endonuclease YncB(Thermonuclease family) n=1 Tax=Rhizobium mongolense TaxID=57676 RepID=A0ABR6IGH6_9HYPH|nr:hypothetical protein [Rhizobium mongolense]MBB4226967.1 endonuclease YncB(thermonuclease family) [Rhizobium mongolense]